MYLVSHFITCFPTSPNMSTDAYKAFIDDALSAMRVDQLRNIIVKISDFNLEEVGRLYSRRGM